MDRLEKIRASLKVIEYDTQNAMDSVLPAHAIDWRRRIVNIYRLLDEVTAEVERLAGERDSAVRRVEAAEAALQLAGIKIAQLSQCAPQPYSHVMPTAFEPTMTEVSNGTAEGRPRR